jgi:aminoglycoside phosphotransferase (APT) family kinase protein
VKASLPKITGAEWDRAMSAFADRCEAVLALLEPAERRRAESMFGRQLAQSLELDPVLLHADLGPAHILCRGDAVIGVIDWSDARLGDPALDLAWVLHGAGEPFAETVLGVYGAESGRVDGPLRERALYFHQIGPWHEVLYGLETGRRDLVDSGLAGVRARLP